MKPELEKIVNEVISLSDDEVDVYSAQDIMGWKRILVGFTEHDEDLWLDEELIRSIHVKNWKPSSNRNDSRKLTNKICEIMRPDRFLSIFPLINKPARWWLVSANDESKVSLIAWRILEYEKLNKL